MGYGRQKENKGLYHHSSFFIVVAAANQVGLKQVYAVLRSANNNMCINKINNKNNSNFTSQLGFYVYIRLHQISFLASMHQHEVIQEKCSTMSVKVSQSRPSVSLIDRQEGGFVEYLMV